MDAVVLDDVTARPASAIVDVDAGVESGRRFDLGELVDHRNFRMVMIAAVIAMAHDATITVARLYQTIFPVRRAFPTAYPRSLT